jgi:hypothetical protein
MPKRRSAWRVTRDPSLFRYAFFISHVAEDSAEVNEVAAAIHVISGRAGRTPLNCFLDVNSWTPGNVNSAVIKQYLLQSAHMVV